MSMLLSGFIQSFLCSFAGRTGKDIVCIEFSQGNCIINYKNANVFNNNSYFT